MFRDRLQSSRFELKYLINEATVVRVRDFALCYLRIDPCGVGQPNYSYPAHSLSLDADEVRITIDREVLTEPNLSGRIKTGMAAPVQSYAGFVILELKFTNRSANWFGDLVRATSAVQTGAAKCVSGVTQLGPRPLQATIPVVPIESVPVAEGVRPSAAGARLRVGPSFGAFPDHS
jgi:hypothetical protein